MAEKRKPSEADIVSAVTSDYQTWRLRRKNYEVQWLVNAALVRGQTEVKWNPILNQIDTKKTPTHRQRQRVNKVLQKVRAKLSKYTKTRPIPDVIGASEDYDDVLNAKATQKALMYQYRRCQLEQKYEEALMQSMQTGKCFWAIRWDENAKAKVKETPNALGKAQIYEVPIGDVAVDVVTAFEILVGDYTLSRLDEQPRVIRVKIRPAREVEKLYDLEEDSIKGDTSTNDIFQYQRQIADLGTRQNVGFSAGEDPETSEKNNELTNVLVIEEFTKPSHMYPKGKYVVVAGQKLLEQRDELPYGFGDSESPYPFVEFVDIYTAGQFWATTMVEQLAGLQEERNRLRSILGEHTKLVTHPKLMIAAQMNLAPEAYNSEAGEKITYNFLPGMPLPQFLTPPPISRDVWENLKVNAEEFDEVSNLYPQSLGQAGNTTSGFQVNLLQEAVDSVHAPDIRRNERALESAYYKIRRLMKKGYDIPRLISIVGRNHAAEAFEFSQDNIDENTEIIIRTQSGLSDLKAARHEQIMAWFQSGLWGNPQDPNVRRRVVSMLDLGAVEEEFDSSRRDEDEARMENLQFSRELPVEDPQPYQNHAIHGGVITDLLKSPIVKTWGPERRGALVRHWILHVSWENPASAMQLAQVYGMFDLQQEIAARSGPPAAPPPPQEQGQPAIPPQGGEMAPPSPQGGDMTTPPPPQGGPPTPQVG